MAEAWSWPGGAVPAVLPTHVQVMMAPMVADLSGDGVPEVVFNAFEDTDEWAGGVLRAVRGDDGTEVWPTADVPYRTTGGGQIAIGEIVASSPGLEIVACSESDPAASTPGHLLLLSAEGALLRRFSIPPNDVPCGFDAPAIGDMDGNGVPEIVVRHVIALANGNVYRRIRDNRAARAPFTTLYDVEGDGSLELVSANGVYRYDGSALWERVVDDGARFAIPDGNVSIADLDDDGAVEIVVSVYAGDHSIYALDAVTGDTEWGPIDINPPELAAVIAADGNPDGGGVPAIGDLDGDRNPEIVLAGGFAVSVFRYDGELAWHFPSMDLSTRQTGVALFDFDGDGSSEVMYGDERAFRVFAGPDGSVRDELCSVNRTLSEYAVVADVDADGHAEIVLPGNVGAVGGRCLDGTPAFAGIRVLQDPEDRWVNTRSIYNQYSYHVTNVEDDGTIPSVEERNSYTLNDDRQNVALLDAPDLVLEDFTVTSNDCLDWYRVSVRIVNRGAAPAPAGLPITVFDATSTSREPIAMRSTDSALIPGESERFEFDVMLDTPSRGIPMTRTFVAVVDDPTNPAPEPADECRTENNTTAPVMVSCP